MKLCECGCGEPAPISTQNSKKYGWVKGEPKRYIHTHARRGKPSPLRGQHFQPFKPNEVIHREDGVSAIIIYWKGQRLECLIDTADYPKVKGYRWTARKEKHTFYVGANSIRVSGRQRNILLHRLLLPDAIIDVDHRDGSGLNNRRENLRPAERNQNSRNQRHKRFGTSSSFLGVSFSKRKQRFVAYITTDGRRKHLGYFADERDAANARNEAARQEHKEFASLNDVPDRDTVSESDFAPVLAAAPQVSEISVSLQ